MATKRSIVPRETGDRVTAVRLEYTVETGQCVGRTHATLGCAAVTVARSGGRALKQERVPGLGCSEVSVEWCAQEAADQAARAPWPPGCQPWSRVIMKVCSMLLAAVSAPRV